MLEWLENWLVQSPCGVLIVSHDRTFLDHTVKKILEMDPIKHILREYPGNYSDYFAQKQTEIDKQWGAYHDQAAETKRMQADGCVSIFRRIRALVKRPTVFEKTPGIYFGFLWNNGAFWFQRTFLYDISHSR